MPDLWCVHVMGPDEFHAAPDFWTALAWATELNGFIVKRALAGEWAKRNDWPLTQALAVRWHGSAEEHARDLERELAARAAHEAKRKAASGSDQPGVTDSVAGDVSHGSRPLPEAVSEA